MHKIRYKSVRRNLSVKWMVTHRQKTVGILPSLREGTMIEMPSPGRIPVSEASGASVDAVALRIPIVRA